jgi:hypothetical protein
VEKYKFPVIKNLIKNGTNINLYDALDEWQGFHFFYNGAKGMGLLSFTTLCCGANEFDRTTVVRTTVNHHIPVSYSGPSHTASIKKGDAAISIMLKSCDVKVAYLPFRFVGLHLLQTIQEQ